MICIQKFMKFSQNHTIMTKLSFTHEESRETFLYYQFVLELDSQVL